MLRIMTLQLFEVVVEHECGNNGSIDPEVKPDTVFEDDAHEATVVMIVLDRALNDAHVGELLKLEFVPRGVINKIFEVDRLRPIIFTTVGIRQSLVIPKLDLTIVVREEWCIRPGDLPELAVKFN